MSLPHGLPPAHVGTALAALGAGPAGERIEETVGGAVQTLRLVVEVMGAAAIGLGVLVSAAAFAGALARRQTMDFTAIRLTLARYLTLGLEFQLGADILSTAVAPSWDRIGKLGAIAVIRTGLNFFLVRELREGGRDRAADPVLRPGPEPV